MEKEPTFDLTARGLIGKYSADEWFNKIELMEDMNAEFVDIVRSADVLKVNGFTFHMNELSQIEHL